MDADQQERYALLLQTKGNKADLFADDPYVASSEYLHYDIPGEALTDERFRKMITEAEKYLGYPYVWGGSSPSTSFDCSGFVSYVINHCGNGWSYGRLGAMGLCDICSIIPSSAARPGDLIFFKNTYANIRGRLHGILSSFLENAKKRLKELHDTLSTQRYIDEQERNLNARNPRKIKTFTYIHERV